APVADEPELRLDVARDEPRVVAEGDLPLGALGDDGRAGERPRPVAAEQPAGMVEVEVAHRDDVDRHGVEAGRPQGWLDPRALVAAHRPGLVVEPVADPGLDEDATSGRFDQEAIERLEQTVLSVDLVADPAVPQRPRHGPEQGSGIRPEGAGSDEGDGRPAAKVASPVDGVVRSGQDASGGWRRRHHTQYRIPMTIGVAR